MSTPSMVLLGAGVATSLAGVWALAGLSERSSLRGTPRVLVAAAAAVLGFAAVYLRTPGELRGALSLPALFGAVSLLGMVAGAAKLEGALSVKNGPRALRRAAGLVAGAFLGMASVAAVSFELLLRSQQQARLGWAYMLPTVVGVLSVFAQRGKLAGAGAKALGQRGLVLGVLGLVLLLGARLLVTPSAANAAPRIAVAEPAAAEAPAPEAVVPAPAPEPPPAASIAPATATSVAPSAAPAPSTPPPSGTPGELQVEAVTTRGLLEADARGGVARRKDRLHACMVDPNNQQRGTLSLKIGIDASGSVTYSKAIGGDLVGTPLGTCLLPVFYKMGFAAPGSPNAYFEITLRAP